MPERTATPDRYQTYGGFCRLGGIRRRRVSARTRLAARLTFERILPQIRASITHITIKPRQEEIIIVFLKGSVIFFIS